MPEILDQMKFAAAGSYLTLIGLRFAGTAGLENFSWIVFAVFVLTLLGSVHLKRKRIDMSRANG